MGSHSGSGHDLFTIVDGLLKKARQKPLSPIERAGLEMASEKVALCQCQVRGSMPDRSEIFTEMLERGHRLMALIQGMRRNDTHPESPALERVAGVSQTLQEVEVGENVIAVDFRNRCRLPD